MSAPAAASPAIAPLISEAALHARIAELAREIAARLPREIMVIALLKGSFMFTADLIRALYREGMTPELDFMTLSSYGASTHSSGQVTLLNALQEEVRGRHVLLVDDILESGHTLTVARAELMARGAASVTVAVLLEKPGKQASASEQAMLAEFVGFVIEDRFVVGYGLDYANRYRELPFIGVLDA